MTDAATAAVAPSSAPPLFGNKNSVAPTQLPATRAPASPAVQRAELSPDARGLADKAAVDRQHNEAASKTGQPKLGEAWVDPVRNGVATADQPGEQRTDGVAASAAEPKQIKLTDDLTVTEDQFREVLARVGVEQSGIATRPMTPEGYELRLPDSFQSPAGADGKPIPFAFDPNAPMTKDAQAWAHRHGLSQAAFSEALQIVAADKLTQQQQFQTAFNAEVAKLGPTVGQRIDAITTFYKGLLGKNATAITNNIWTADMVKAHEAIISRFANQGAGGFSQSHREPGDASSKITEEQWGRMSSADRLDYARSASSTGRRP